MAIYHFRVTENKDKVHSSYHICGYDGKI